MISDWTRGGRAEGPELLERLRTDAGTRAVRRLPVIYYVGDASPDRRARAAELGAVALTNAPDELLKFALVELSVAR